MNVLFQYCNSKVIVQQNIKMLLKYNGVFHYWFIILICKYLCPLTAPLKQSWYVCHRVTSNFVRTFMFPKTSRNQNLSLIPIQWIDLEFPFNTFSKQVIITSIFFKFRSSFFYSVKRVLNRSPLNKNHLLLRASKNLSHWH